MDLPLNNCLTRTMILLTALFLPSSQSTVNLANQSPKLTSIPAEISTATTELNVNDNLIAQFGNLTGLNNLQTLRLDSNNITTFPDLSAIGPNLQNLYLNYNNISSIPYQLLNVLTALVRLEIRASSLDALPDAPGPGNTLTKLYVLENQFTEIPVLPNLLRSLSTLGLQYNSVAATPAQRFADYPEITELLLNHNLLTEFPDLSLVRTTLVNLRLPYNNIPYIPYELVNMLTALRYLALEHNPITQIHDLTGPTLFRSLLLDWTGITQYPDITNMGRHMMRLRLHGLDLGRLPDGYLSLCPTLRYYDHNHNPSRGVFPDITVVAGSLRELHLYNNNLPDVPYEMLNILTSLRTADFGGNGLTSIPDCQGPSNHLNKLFLQDNLFTSIPSLVIMGAKISHLNLNNNRIEHVDTNVFVHYPLLQKLELNHNRLTQLFDLRPLQTTITYVDLRHNSLQVIPNQHLILPDQQNNISLYLDNNQLQQVPNFSQLARVSVTFTENPLVCNGSLGWAGSRSDVYCYLPNDDTPHSVRQLNRKWLRLPGVRRPILGSLRSGWEDILADDDKTSCVNIDSNSHRRLTPCSGFPSSLVTVLSDENLNSGQYVLVNVTHDGNCIEGEIDVYADESNLCRSYGLTSRMSSSTSRVVDICDLLLVESQGDVSTCSYRCQSRSNIIIAVNAGGSVSSLCDVSYSVI